MPEDLAITSEAWNVGFQYSNEMIFAPLIMFDKYSTVALYGAEDLEVALGLLENLKNTAKIQAIDRMLLELEKVFRNSEFKIKQQDKKKFIELEENLDKVQIVIKAVSTKEYNQIENNETIKINEKHFNNCLNELIIIRRAIVPLLNNAGFIYKTSEDLTKESIFDRFVNQG